MANKIAPHGRFRISSCLPPQAALQLIAMAAAADRSMSAYVADILMSHLIAPPPTMPRLLGARRPKSDANPARTAGRMAKADAARVQKRKAQVAKVVARVPRG